MSQLATVDISEIIQNCHRQTVQRPAYAWPDGRLSCRLVPITSCSVDGERRDAAHIIFFSVLFGLRL